MPFETFGDGTPFALTELDENGNPGRVFSFTGRALPYRPIKFPGSQRLEATWYPGNPVATAQVFGAKEDPTTFNGFWKDRFLSDGDTLVFFGGVRLTNCVDVESAAQEFRRQGKAIKMTWDVHVRVGFLVKFEPTWHNRHDCEWEMQFEWISFNDAAFAKPLVPATGIFDFVSSVQMLCAQIQQYIDMGRGYSQGYINAVNTQLENVNTIVASLVETAEAAVNAVLSPVQQARKTAAIISSIDLQCAGLVATVNATPDIVRADAGASTPYGLTLALENLSRQVGSTGSQIREQAANQRVAIALQADPQVIGSFTSREDMDLRDVSTRFYGSPNDWLSIKTYNNLVGSRLSAGQTILLPELQIAPGQ